MNNNKIGVWIAIGIGLGSAIGVATNNIGLWIGVGVALGAGIGTTLNEKSKKNATKTKNKE